jgi:hypothetical protein
VHHVVLGDEPLRPVVEHVSGRDVVGDAEGEVQVGEPVAGPRCERSHRGTGDDALVLLRELQHMLPECVALLDSEHVDVVGRLTPEDGGNRWWRRWEFIDRSCERGSVPASASSRSASSRWRRDGHRSASGSQPRLCDPSVHPA